MKTCALCGEDLNNKIKTSEYFFTNVRNNLIICGKCIKLAFIQLRDKELIDKIRKIKESEYDSNS